MSDEGCAVCGGEMDVNRAICNQCGRAFHLALRVDAGVTDCGDAWIDDEVQALVFGCNRCLGRATPAGPKHYQRRSGVRASAVARARRRHSV